MVCDGLDSYCWPVVQHVDAAVQLLGSLSAMDGAHFHLKTDGGGTCLTHEERYT